MPLIFSRINTLFDKLSTSQLRWLVVFLSALLAGWVMYIQHGWINHDSVTYFEASRLFSAGEWKKSLDIWGWPLYPFLISVLHMISGLNYYLSAQIINAILFMLCCYCFTHLIEMCGGSKKTILAGTALLFSNSYVVGDVLPMLMRDEGFWAFTLASYIFFIRFFQELKLKDALLWQTCIVIAMLFRVEAISIMLGLPLILLWRHQLFFRQKLEHYIIANLLLVISMIVIVTLYLSDFIKLTSLGRLNEIIEFATGNFVQTFHVLVSKSEQFGSIVLGKFLVDYALLAFSVSLLVIIVAKMINISGLVVALLVATNLKSTKKIMSPIPSKILLWAMSINFINMLFILLKVYVLSGRYIIGFVLILLIFASFSLQSFWESPSSQVIRSKKINSILKIILVGYMLVSFVKITFPKNETYNYEQQAVSWIKKHSSNQDKVFYVSPRMRYYASAPYESRGYDYWDYTQAIIQNKRYLQYDYLAINIEKQHLEQEDLLIKELPEYAKVKEFWGFKKKKKVIILKKNL